MNTLYVLRMGMEFELFLIWPKFYFVIHTHKMSMFEIFILH